MAAGRQRRDLLLQLAAESLDEVPRENRNVVRAIAQRRNRDRKHRQAEIEILAELLRGDGRAQALVGRRDDPHVDVQRGRAADPFEPALLERAQNLRLQADRQVADFVEEQRAAMRQLELRRACAPPRR